MFEKPSSLVAPGQETRAMTSTEVESDRASWLAWRKAGIGGSDAAAIIGEDPYRTPLDVYIDKTSRHINEEERLIFQRGLALEPIIADRYTAETGRKLRKQPVKVHHDHDFIRCTVDRQILAGDDNTTGLLEMKTASTFVFRKMQLDGIPTKYWVQVQHNLMVWGYDLGAIAVLCPDTWEFMHFDIERDEDFCASLTAREVEFWRLVESGTPPELAQPKGEKLPTVGGELVRADSLDERMAAQFQKIQQAVTTAAAIKAEAEEFHARATDAAKEWMLANGIDVIEGFGSRIYYKEQAGRSSFDKKALAAAHPEIDLSQYEKRGAPFRTFRVYNVERTALNEGVM